MVQKSVTNSHYKIKYLVYDKADNCIYWEPWEISENVIKYDAKDQFTLIAYLFSASTI